ncbi:SerA Phosphoglycerate dehydrogenase and related dehydrogenases [Candidatus Nanopelagicaceae bacterium]
MKSASKVAVCSRSFSANEVLRNELLQKYPNTTFNVAGNSLLGDELFQFIKGHEKVIVGLEKITGDLISKLPELKVVSKFGVGLDSIDLEALEKNSISLGWTSGSNSLSVAELVVSNALTLLRGTHLHKNEILNGIWRQTQGSLLSGKRIGILGCNHVGREVVKLLTPWGCSFDIVDIVEIKEIREMPNVSYVDLDTMLKQADIVTVHLPLNKSTENILPDQKIRLLKPNSILINTSRGGLIDEQAVKAALSENRIFAAAFDVFDSEPPRDLELVKLANFLATPHIGGSTIEATLTMGRAAIRGLDVHEIPAVKADNKRIRNGH